MATTIEGSKWSRTAGGTIPIYGLVKLDADGDVTVCGLADDPIGSCDQAAVVGDKVSISLLSKSGSIKCIVSSSATIGDMMYTVASGEVDDVAATGSTQIGVLATTAAADQDIVEVVIQGAFLVPA